jgi:peptidoglycan/LPS O-acetylase OafA/YrhL
MNNRIHQLDSIRGIAAFSVVLSHIPYFALGLPLIFYQGIVWLGIHSGHTAVMLFFVLSGFVLSIPFLETLEINYFPYVIKRIFRIYVPYLITLIVAILLSQIFLTYTVEVINEWDLLWYTRFDLKIFMDHLLFLGNYDTNAYNGVIWSLVHELRISFIFPFIVLFVKYSKWKLTILICLMFTFIAGLNNIFVFQESLGYRNSYFDTIQYLPLFMFGALLAKHRIQLTTYFQKMEKWQKWVFLVFSIILYRFSEQIVFVLYEVTKIEMLSTHFWIIMEYTTAVGVIGIMINALGSFKLARLLMIKPLLFLGKISYSLYLLHLPIILSCIYLFQHIFPLWIISIISVPISITISSIAYFIIEDPSNKFGRRFARKVKGKVWKHRKSIA